MAWEGSCLLIPHLGDKDQSLSGYPLLQQNKLNQDPGWAIKAAGDLTLAFALWAALECVIMALGARGDGVGPDAEPCPCVLPWSSTHPWEAGRGQRPLPLLFKLRCW